MKNWFNTLSEALDSENLLDSWEIHFSGINYDSTFSWTWNDGTKYGHYITIYRDSNGRYERPVHYKR
jgi:predicted heme/steroid binding protein